MYDLFAYDRMVRDTVRMAAFEEALRRVIRPGATVIDIGTGTGACALLACRLGAGRVIAIEPTPVIQVARENASRNGLAERIEFIEKTSQDVALAERADVIVSDLRGVLPWFEQHIPSIVDARTRLLEAGGTLVGSRDRVCAALVDLGSGYAPWSVCEPAGYALDLGAALRYERNTPLRRDLTHDALMSEPAAVSTIDYMTVDSPHARERFELTASRAGVVHGMAMWLEAELAEGVQLSSAPGAPPVVYGQLFFPWPEPLRVEAGSRAAVEFRADLTGAGYTWTWCTTIEDGSASRAPTKFEQSTFHGQPMSAEYLARGRMDATPELDTEGRIQLAVLSAMDRATPLIAIAEGLLARFPDRFASPGAALDRVARVARQHGR